MPPKILLTCAVFASLPAADPSLASDFYKYKCSFTNDPYACYQVGRYFSSYASEFNSDPEMQKELHLTAAQGYYRACEFGEDRLACHKLAMMIKKGYVDANPSEEAEFEEKSCERGKQEWCSPRGLSLFDMFKRQVKSISTYDVKLVAEAIYGWIFGVEEDNIEKYFSEAEIAEASRGEKVPKWVRLGKWEWGPEDSVTP